MTQPPAQPHLTPQFCFSTGALRDFLRLSRATVDDSITQNLNALVTPARAGFDPTSTSQRTPRSFPRQIDSQACQNFKDQVLFPTWHARAEVLHYCGVVATSPDPDDPEALLRQIEAAKDKERVVNERLDPYSGRFFPREPRTEQLAMLIRQEKGVENIVRTRTWDMVKQRCGESANTWEEALAGWRSRAAGKVDGHSAERGNRAEEQRPQRTRTLALWDPKDDTKLGCFKTVPHQNGGLAITERDVRRACGHWWCDFDAVKTDLMGPDSFCPAKSPPSRQTVRSCYGTDTVVAVAAGRIRRALSPKEGSQLSLGTCVWPESSIQNPTRLRRNLCEYLQLRPWTRTRPIFHFPPHALEKIRVLGPRHNRPLLFFQPCETHFFLDDSAFFSSQCRRYDPRPTTDPMPQPLNSKEASLFRAVIRAYEDKQYKRGLKSADLILKKNPKHGDTMAMKALIMNAQGKTEEAFALGKEALTVDMKSHICWHVYGLLYRANKNFEEAIKAYKFALKLEPESTQIQRDLAILQVQMRDYAGYISSRTAMLQARPQLRQSWTALAIAHHLSGDLSAAENVLTTYEGTLKSTPSRSDYENSEAVMYKNTIIAEQGDYQRALEHLESAAKHNLDRLEYLELRAKYLVKLGKKEEAIAAWQALVERNADRPAYFEGLESAHAFSDSDAAARKEIYEKYAKKFPRSDAPRRLPLNFLSGDDFSAAAKEYLTLMFNKGVPSTFANLKHLYSDSAKKEALEALAQDYLKSSSNSEATNGDRSKGEAAALYFLAQHYNYHLSRDLTKAHEYVDKAIEKVPDSVDFTMTKARIWKHQGNLQKASETMDKARTLDTRDRYINTKAAKYQLRNNETEQALKTVGLFTRADTVGGPLADLLDMQCVWFLSEDGEAYARQGDDALALKRFHTVHNIFDVWQEDQFDFHSFSLRKGQIRAYVDMVRWEDHLRDHPFYSRAALDAVAIYLRRADRPAANGVNGDANGDDASERKKAAKKAKKEQQRLEREAADRAAKQDPNKGKPASEEPKKKDEDPLGLKLLEAEPLSAAMRFVAPLLQFSPQNINAQFAGFDVYLRRKKYVLALRSLNAARELDASHPGVHERVVEFAHVVRPALESLPTKVQELIKSEFTPPAGDLKKYNEEFLSNNKAKPTHIVAALKTRRVLGEDSAKAEADLANVVKAPDATFELATEVYNLLKAWRSSEAETLKKEAHARWPEVSLFA
ncbi:acetyltransferase [Colletotrichum scovillei]|uniref:Acetyltransferase n=2 Tax=Colletotrichum scovillei TaxID=1209932 RepID=A0A9P7UEM7_9PEZI|nr:acetyltransferase [Colletotrichum scovillei]KAG7068822.1 acetyltransferase [Colletotrichum scovillei]KAG7072778.1 acetyltransferase [Colletotrichum scovillei]